jgi:hypothetical protein
MIFDLQNKKRNRWLETIMGLMTQPVLDGGQLGAKEALLGRNCSTLLLNCLTCFLQRNARGHINYHGVVSVVFWQKQCTNGNNECGENTRRYLSLLPAAQSCLEGCAVREAWADSAMKESHYRILKRSQVLPCNSHRWRGLTLNWRSLCRQERSMMK